MCEEDKEGLTAKGSSKQEENRVTNCWVTKRRDKIHARQNLKRQSYLKAKNLLQGIIENQAPRQR